MPIRIGTLLLAAIAAAASGVLAGIAFTHGDLLGQHLSPALIIVFGVVFAIVCAVSVFGFIGCFISSHALVKLFSIVLWIATVVVIGYLVLFSVLLFENKAARAQDCQNSLTNSTANSDVNSVSSGVGNTLSSAEGTACSALSTAYVIGHIVLYAIIALFSLYFAGVTSRFSSQLSREQGYNNSHRRLHDEDSYPLSQQGPPGYGKAFDSRVSVNEYGYHH